MQALEPQKVVQAYRSLYRSALRAVAYSVPARYVVKAQLRKAFRNGSSANYNQTRIDNTVEFLNQAAKARWIEHKIVKNLIHVHYYERENTLQARLTEQKSNIAWHSQETKDGYRSFYNALKVFNDNHQLCLV